MTVAMAASLLAMPLPVSASAPPSGLAEQVEMVCFQPFWDNVDSISAALSATDGVATGAVIIRAKPGTTDINATITLSRVNANGSLTTVRTWPNQTVAGTTLMFSDTHNLASGGKHRLTVSARVTRNGTTETVSSWVERDL